MHHWMDHWLYDVPNGIMNEPMATIERPNGTWEERPTWPEAGTTNKTLYLAGAGDGVSGRLVMQPAGTSLIQTFTDNPSAGETVQVDQPETVKASRLVYASAVLTTAVRISGTPHVKVTAKLDSASAPLTALLVDYGTSTQPNARNQSFLELYAESCTLDDVDDRTGCARAIPRTDATTTARVITRGSIDTKNRVSIYQTQPAVANTPFQIEWDLHPKDYVFPVGHRIGLVIIGNLEEWVAVDAAAHNVSITLADSRLTLPVASGL